MRAMLSRKQKAAVQVRCYILRNSKTLFEIPLARIPVFLHQGPPKAICASSLSSRIPYSFAGAKCTTELRSGAVSLKSFEALAAGNVPSRLRIRSSNEVAR